MIYCLVYSRGLGGHVINDDIYHVASQSSSINKTIGHHTEDVRKIDFKVQTHLSAACLVVIRQWHLSRGLPVFENKRPRDKCRWSIYSTEVSSHFETSLAALLCVKTYCLVYSWRPGGHVIRQWHLSRGLPVFENKQDNRSSHRGGQKYRFQSANSPQWCKSCGHTSTTFITWPYLQHWGEFAFWNLSCCPPLCEDLLSCLLMKTGRPRDKCRWRMTTRLTPLR
jgi:hypothetical protein